jgi:SPX domain protein involved in polyphosphate accumulation
MKFGKWLKRQVEQSPPEWREHFLCYKELKRYVKTVAGGRTPTPEEEAGFVGPLDAEVEKINAFFLDQEGFVICHHQLQEEVMRVVACNAASVQHEAEATSVRREVVNFHGEIVLLLNYSSVNYIGRTSINRKKDWILVTFS